MIYIRRSVAYPRFFFPIVFFKKYIYMPIKYNKLAMQSKYDRLAVPPATHGIKQISLPLGKGEPKRNLEPTALRWVFYDAENDKIVDRSEPLEKEQTFKSDILKKK